MNLHNKNIILTGGTSGIGLALLKELLKFDVNIVVASLGIDSLDLDDPRIIPYECDMSLKENIDNMFDFALEKLGAIDIIFANAGFAYYEKINNTDYKHIEKIYKTNVFAPIYICEKMYELYKDEDYKVVITASTMAKLPLPGYSLYSSTKAAIDSFSEAYRYELNKKNKISVVYPIATKTNFFDVANVDTPVPFPSQTPEQVAQAIIKGVLKDKVKIHTSKLFQLTYYLNKFFPFILKSYSKIQDVSFKNWLMNKSIN